MHELGICDALLKLVEKTVEEEQLEGVKSITVEVGTLSGVIPRFLSDCWEAVADGTALEGVCFKIDTVEGTAQCLDCGKQFVADLENLKCPHCGGAKLMPLSGRDLTLKEIEAY